MPPQTLRSYQTGGIRQIFGAWRQGARKVLGVAPTGSGKTSVFSWIAARVPGRVLILVHRRELAVQATRRLHEFGIDYGMILAGEVPKPYARVQVASVQTLVRRAPPPARYVIVDEAHLSTAETWAKILDCYPDAFILGMTATPWRLSGKPLASAYDHCLVIATPGELRGLGYLCDYSGFSYLAPDLSNVKTTAGEYNEKQSAEAMRQPAIVTNIVDQWGKHARDLSTVVFAVTVDHSKDVAAQFRAVGVQAEHLDGSTPLHIRSAILRRVEEGRTRVLCNVGVAIEGLDIPRLKCCIDANPTKSVARALQKWGRVRRPWQGIKARIHDHAFNIKTHGLPDADRDYTLDAEPEDPPELNRCEQCLAMYAGPRCTACGHAEEREPAGERELVTVDTAEQFDFDSGTAAAVAELAEVKLTADDLPPVPVRWETPGRVIEGRYTGVANEKTSYGYQRIYAVTSSKRRYLLPGATHLNTLMARVRLGDTIRVSYVGTIHGSKRKVFELERDEVAAA